MKKTSFRLILAALAATAALVGCTKEISSEYGRAGDTELSVTAVIDGGTKVSYEKVDGALQPGWEMGDKIIGFDGSGNTYGYEVTDISESGEATLSRIRSDEEYKGSAPTYFDNGTRMYMFYAPGSKPSDITDKSLSVSLADQDATTVPALMMTQATVKDNSLKLIFRNKTAIIGINNPQMEFPNKEYTDVVLSGQGIKTEVVFSVDGNGDLQASYQTEGPVRKALNLTSDDAGVLNGVIYIVACPTEEETDLNFSFNGGDETFTREGFVIREGHYYTSNPVVEKTSFTITIDNAIGHGTFTTDPAGKAPCGTKVEISPDPEEGYEVKSISVIGDDSGDDIEAQNATFTMPKENVTITGEFVLATYEIIPEVIGGQCQIQKGGEEVTSAQMGEEITVSITPDAGYSGGTVTVKKVNAGAETGNEIPFSDGKFTMPASDVGICVEFTKEDYAISKTDAVNGSFTVKNSSGAEIAEANYQDVITVDATPDDGYIVDAITVTDADSNPVTVSENTFTMPDKGVTVSVTFKVPVSSVSLNKESISLTVGASETLTATVNPTNATNPAITWSSTNETVATVTANGEVKGISAGEATITATSMDDNTKIGSCEVKITAEIVFSVGFSKKVRFTKGNLYWDGSSYQFEKNQYDYRHYNGISGDAAVINGEATTTPSGTVGSFWWISSTETGCKPYDKTYTQTLPTGVPLYLFTTNQDFAVNGEYGKYRVLSSIEWNHLLRLSGSGRTSECLFAKARVKDVNGLLIFPDNYSLPSGYQKDVGGTGMAVVNSKNATFPQDDSIPDEVWLSMESDGVIFLPAAGYRAGTEEIKSVGSIGHYLPSSVNAGGNGPVKLLFSNSNVSCEGSMPFNSGNLIRLVYEDNGN